METKGERIIPVNIEKQMKSAYIDYSMSVIVSRALPDVRDGFKLVHRRIMYAMWILKYYRIVQLKISKNSWGSIR